MNLKVAMRVHVQNCNVKSKLWQEASNSKLIASLRNTYRNARPVFLPEGDERLAELGELQVRFPDKFQVTSGYLSETGCTFLACRTRFDGVVVWYVESVTGAPYLHLHLNHIEGSVDDAMRAVILVERREIRALHERNQQVLNESLRLLQISERIVGVNEEI